MYLNYTKLFFYFADVFFLVFKFENFVKLYNIIKAIAFSKLLNRQTWSLITP